MVRFVLAPWIVLEALIPCEVSEPKFKERMIEFRVEREREMG